MSASTQITEYPQLPRIDVHAHLGGDVEMIGRYLKIRETLQEKHGVDLAMWIDLGGSKAPECDLEEVDRASEGRVLCCIHDFAVQLGIRRDPEELAGMIDRGYIGYKIWSGPPQRRSKDGPVPHPYIDDPAHEPTFTRMEEAGIVGASIHIADPNGPFGDRHEWLPDPVEFWRNITAWRHVLERHRRLRVINAHMCWLCCQDAQLDYLRNMLATFPGLYVDLAATFQYFYLLDRENLRAFMVEEADRILFGTDIGRLGEGEDEEGMRAGRYFQCFRILESEEVVPGGFFGQNAVQGLGLPAEVLEKIYWRNAARIYPRVWDRLRGLGYGVGSAGTGAGE